MLHSQRQQYIPNANCAHHFLSHTEREHTSKSHQRNRGSIPTVADIDDDEDEESSAVAPGPPSYSRINNRMNIPPDHEARQNVGGFLGTVVCCYKN